jgi:hypothetical protein
MASPVQKVWYLEKNHLPTGVPLYVAYETALSHYTFIADDSPPSVAVDKKVFSEHFKELHVFLHPEEGDFRMEVWKYDPAPLADGPFIDKLSLALCYRDTDDDRIRKGITDMIKKYYFK